MGGIVMDNGSNDLEGVIRPAVSRRAALRVVGVASVLGIAGGAGALRGSWASAAPAASDDDCVVTPEVTEGPYWVDARLKRSDVRSNADGTDTQTGVPLALTIYLRDSNCGGVASGAWIDIWHANDDGVYSDESVESTSSQTWLRGYQITDDDGKVSFVTVFPGWYSGRTIHIHLRVRTFDGSTTTTNYTTQLFFAEADNNAVLATSDYTRAGKTRDTTNATDMVYQQEVAAGGAVLVPLSGNTTDGYAGTVIAEFIGDTSAADSSVSATLKKVAAHRVSKRRRTVAVSFHAGETVTAVGELKLHGSVVEKSARKSYAKGTHTVTLSLRNSVGSGQGHVVLGLEDGAGNVKALKHPVKVPK
jgi:protocatechuate 3,4-dioxygenase beta subunit